MGDEEDARCFRCFENYVNLAFAFIVEKRFFLKSESSSTTTATNNQSMKFVAKYNISPRDYQVADFNHSDSSCINFVRFAGIAKRKKDNDEHRDRLIQIREPDDGRQVEVGFVNEVTDSRNQGGRKGILGSRSSQMFDISCVLAFTILFIYAEARYILARCVPSMYTYALRDMEENSEQRSVRKRNKGMAERSVEDLKRPAEG